MTPSQKNRAQHKKIRLAAEQITDTVRAWRDHLGDHQFNIKPMPVDDPELTSHLCGPVTMTQQFERTVRK